MSLLTGIPVRLMPTAQHTAELPPQCVGGQERRRGHLRAHVVLVVRALEALIVSFQPACKHAQPQGVYWLHLLSVAVLKSQDLSPELGR